MSPQKYFLNVCCAIVSQLENSINIIKTRSVYKHVFIDMHLEITYFVKPL